MRAVAFGRTLTGRLPKIQQWKVYRQIPAARELNSTAAHVIGRHQQRYTTNAASSMTYDAPPQELSRQRVFTIYPVYKGSGAVQISVIGPTWKAVGPGDVAVERQGTMFLEFAEPMQGSGSSPGERRYNWEQKQTFAMSAVELSHIIEPEKSGMKPLVHDPNMRSGAAGSTIKTLSISQQPDGANWFVRLGVKTGAQQRSVGVNFTKQEFCTLQILAKFAIPHLLGFDAAFGTNINFPVPPENEGPPF